MPVIIRFKECFTCKRLESEYPTYQSKNCTKCHIKNKNTPKLKICKRCGIGKPTSEFRHWSNRRCRECDDVVCFSGTRYCKACDKTKLIDEFAVGKCKAKLHQGRQWYCTRCIDNKMIEKSKFYKENGTKGYGYYANLEHKQKKLKKISKDRTNWEDLSRKYCK